VERSLPILLAAGFSVRVAALPAGEDPDSLIRTKGPDAFRELATNAPDYFEFAVSEAGRDLEDAGKKSTLVRKLAGFAASLPDAVGRESVAARIGPRLAISPQAFLASVPKTAPNAPLEEESESEPPGTATESPDAVIRLLLHAALVDLEARKWLAAQDTTAALGSRPGAALLATCLRAGFDPADSAATQTFVAAQDPATQSILAALLLGRPPANPLAIARESLRNLTKRDLEARRESVTARLRNPGLDTGEIARLQAEAVDITKEIRQISGSHSQRQAGSPPDHTGS
jgi:DNA primase